MVDFVSERIDGFKDELIALRRDFHMHPEVGFNLYRTSGIVKKYLDDLGIETCVMAETGVVGLLKGDYEGPTIMFRADMDALPVTECTGLPFASIEKGKMHACGHDGHTATLMVAAKVLAGMKDKLHGNVKFVFQPNEERGGADEMVAAGCMEHPKVDFCFGVHLWQPTENGKISLTAGPVMAGHDDFVIKIKGKSAHSAQPYNAVDAVFTAANIIINLQTIQTRQIDAMNPTVLLVNMVKAGTAPNVISDYAEICGSLRYLYDASDNLPSHPQRRIREMAEKTCDLYGASCEVEFSCTSRTVINDAAAVERIRPVAKSVFGEDKIETSVFMMGENFSSYLEKAPGAFAFIGIGSDEKGTNYAHHNPKFNIDEDMLPKGVELFVRLALDYLK